MGNCIEIKTVLAPRPLLAQLHRIEDSHGRESDPSRCWGPRSLDLDLLTL
ncbi:MAG: 2-amino-4-hydroxy-6-hydroxymethyldihydropteridine diphosphokinase [Alphaproteobacteria bacterium]|nr:2-amino-4-hydroxy-6-hydroxymethyldihydropteridine diphosphokinase [Alphaproteobacteria bacterium]